MYLNAIDTVKETFTDKPDAAESATEGEVPEIELIIKVRQWEYHLMIKSLFCVLPHVILNTKMICSCTFAS